MALPGGANRINEWPVPNPLGTPSVHRCGARPAPPSYLPYRHRPGVPGA